MRSLHPSTLIAPVLALLAAAPTAAQEPFLDLDPAAALARAEKAKRIVVIFFHDAQEAESRRMLTQTFGDEPVRRWLAAKTVPILVPASNAQACTRFGVTRFPHSLLLRPDARILHQLSGYQDPDGFLVSGETAALGVGEAKRPEGDDALRPIAWLAWANWLFANAPERAEEAAEAYYECLDHGDENMPGFRARHLEFLLERLNYLKSRSLPALEGLMSRRRDLQSHIAAGAATPEMAYEYTRFNWWMRDEYMTVELFDMLGEFDTPEHEACRRVLLAEELKRIVAHRKYEGVLELIPDPLAVIDGRLRDYERTLAAGSADTSVRARIIDDAAALYECLLFSGRGADAMELVDAVTGKIPSGRAFFAFVEHAIRLGHHELARKIVAKGLEVVKGENGRKMLERAAARIPDEDGDEARPSTTPIPAKGKGGDGR